MPHREGYRCRHCPQCGAIIGVAPEREAVSEERHFGPWNEKAPCAKTHKYPIRKSVKKWQHFGLIRSNTISYEDGSRDDWEECGIRGCGYQGFWFWLAGLYVKFTGRKVEPWSLWSRPT